MKTFAITLLAAGSLFASVATTKAHAANVNVVQNTIYAAFQDYNWIEWGYQASVARDEFTVDFEWPEHRLLNLGTPYDTPTINPTYAGSPYFCEIETTSMTNYTSSYYVSCAANLPTNSSISYLFKFRVWGYQEGTENPDGDCTILSGTCDLWTSGIIVE